MLTANFDESVMLIGDEIKKSENAYFSLRKKRQRIEMRRDGNIFYLEKGSISVYRVENDLVTVSFTAPAILGLAQMRNDVMSHYLRCDTDCEMWVMNATNANEMLTRKNLWMHAFDILTNHLQRYFQRENLRSHKTIREIVIEHVKHIWSLEPDVREKTSVYTFILSRNHISRSAIHKVLQELVNEEKLTLNRGKLATLNL
ncbi:helix-turn-helix domain-containing protein [Buttiauxella izardii]|uniref:Transcriptional regulator n=1 Tax=Buttiauxella izardii TaxID=82991 RepID=A0A3A5JY99_9ENTR|nr:helix-turn-helix domain-containing protein [Buttiauxella izardii]RJT23205.1 transcriptional regulator [Buttiauxella izardii]